MKKRLISLLLALAFCLSLLPTAAFAEEVTVVEKNLSDGSVTIEGNGTYKITQSTSGSTTNTITVAAGVTATIYLSGVNIDVSASAYGSAFKINSEEATPTSIKLILVGENTLKSGERCAGLQTSRYTTLTISGEGTLYAYGGKYGAGIGGGHSNGDTNCTHGGTIVINGGIITATGGDYGAGIGDGDYDGNNTSPGVSASVIINGGIVKAKSGGKDAANDIGRGADKYNTSGTFSSGEDGNAVIYADSYTDSNGKANAQGVFFNYAGTEGTVQGNPTITVSLTLESGSTLTIPEGASLSFGTGGSLTLKSGSTLYVYGTFPTQLTIAEGANVTIVVADGIPVPKKYEDIVTKLMGKWQDTGNYDKSWYNDTDTEFTLTTPQELAGLAVLANSKDFSGITIKLGDNIDLSGKLWTPFGFEGTFDGQGHSITGVTITECDYYCGFFAYLYGAEVKNLTVSGSVKSPDDTYTGGVAGVAIETTFDNVHCSVTIDDSEAHYIGGLVGSLYSSQVVNCSTEGTITVDEGNYVRCGGITGRAYYSTILNSYSTVSITASNSETSRFWPAGIAGTASHSTIQNCWFGGKLPDTSYACGIVADYNANIENNYSDATGNDDAGGSNGISSSGMDRAALVENLNNGLTALRTAYPDVTFLAWTLENGQPTFGDPEEILQEPTAENPSVSVSNPEKVVSYQWQESVDGQSAAATVKEADSSWARQEDTDIWNSTNKHVDNSSSNLVVTYTVEAGECICFRWKVSSESDYDWLYYKLKNSNDAVIKEEWISGEVDWSTVSYTVHSAGTYTLTFTYKKDVSGSRDPDCGTVDLTSQAATIWSDLDGYTGSALTNAQSTALAGKTVRCVVTYQDGQTLTTSAFVAQALQTEAALSLSTGTITGAGDTRTVPLTATVTGESGTATGNVTFYNNGAEIGSAELGADGTATLNWEAAANTDYSITASYAGDQNYLPASSSAPLTGNTARRNQSIQIAGIEKKTYGDRPFELTLADAGVGTGAVTWTSSNERVVSISGNIATIHGSGQVTITATKAADDTFNGATASVTLTVQIPAYMIPGVNQQETATQYPVNVTASEDGSVSASAGRAEAGETITVTATPDDYHTLKTVSVVDEDGEEVAVSENRDGTYSFTMPESSVTVSAEFDWITGTAGSAAKTYTTPFTDISGSKFKTAIAYCYGEGLMEGVSATTFDPDAELTRAMVVTVLYRLSGSPIVSAASEFSDVEVGQWYSDAVVWATANGIVTGYTDGSFGPNDPVTREQLAAILYRYASAEGAYVGSTFPLDGFSDSATVSSYAVTPMMWAVNNGTLVSRTVGVLDARESATRAEVANALTVLCKSVLD